MLLDFALIFLFALFFSKVFNFIKLPDVVSMIFAGVLLNYFNLISDNIIGISADLRQIALVIILSRAGLSLEFSKLKKIGKPAFLMSTLPATFEILSTIFFSQILFNIPLSTSIILGCVVSAVSPAIIVPRMIKMQENGYGVAKNIPELILASASVDDIFVITLFYASLDLDTKNLFLLPVNILLGVFFGVITAFVLLSLNKRTNYNVNNFTIIFISCSFILIELSNYISFSALLSIMVLGIVFRKINPHISQDLSKKFTSLWSFFSQILFVLVGVGINLEYTLSEGVKPMILILICLVFRSIGTYICLIKSNLTQNERLFCVFSYLPKATVQAGIGTIPLSLGLPYGELIATIAVISIIITAPLGSFFMDNFYKKLLTKDEI